MNDSGGRNIVYSIEDALQWARDAGKVGIKSGGDHNGATNAADKNEIRQQNEIVLRSVRPIFYSKRQWECFGVHLETFCIAGAMRGSEKGEGSRPPLVIF